MYRAGFPRGAESSFGTSGYAGTFASHISALEKHDPTYIDDFWTVPGYMGADGELATSLVEEKTTVTARGHRRRPRRAPATRAGACCSCSRAAAPGDTPAGVVLDGMSPAVMVGAAMRFVHRRRRGPQAVLHRRRRRHAPRRRRYR